MSSDCFKPPYFPGSEHTEFTLSNCCEKAASDKIMNSRNQPERLAILIHAISIPRFDRRKKQDRFVMGTKKKTGLNLSFQKKNYCAGVGGGGGAL